MVSFILDRVLTRSERVSDWMFASMLMGISIMVKAKRLLVPSFRRRLDEKHFTAQIKVRGNAIGRTFIFRNGKFSSLDGVGPEADICMIFRDTASAVQLMAASTNYLKQINAMKNFVVDVEGPDEYAVWFMQTIKMLQRIRSEPVCGIPMGGGGGAMSTTPMADRCSSMCAKAESSVSPWLRSTRRTPVHGPSMRGAEASRRPAGERSVPMF